MARIALAGFLHETNTFAPMQTSYSDFAHGGGPYAGLLEGEEIFKYRGKRYNRAACGFLNLAEALGHEIVPILYTAAEPSNQVSADAFNKIMDRISAGLQANGPFEGLFLDLHGAMVYEEFNDGETEILRKCREIVGDVPVVVALDLHGNISRKSFELATVMVGYRTYPHIDIYETGERCAHAMNDLLRGITYIKAFRPLPFLMPLSKQSTNNEPCRSIFNEIAVLEKSPEVLSCSIINGFPPADLYHTGPTVLAYGTSQWAADRAGDLLYERILEVENAFVIDLMNPSQAVEKAVQIANNLGKPVLLADIQDNAGAGGTSDTVWILEELVRANATSAALGLMFDPAAAQAAHNAGIGSDISLELGGKLTPGQSPFLGEFRVKNLFDGEFIATGPMFNGMPTNFGKMANLQIGNVEIVVVSKRAQANDQSFFKVVGIEPSEKDILVVKSSNHYRADFEPIAGEIIEVDAPGAFFEDSRKTPYIYLREGVRLFGNGPEFSCESNIFN